MALKLIDRIITQLDKDEKLINVYLDLSKSFVTIDHIILLDKLKYYGVHATNLNLFINSNMLSVTTGVPQCLIIGLLL